LRHAAVTRHIKSIDNSTIVAEGTDWQILNLTPPFVNQIQCNLSKIGS